MAFKLTPTIEEVRYPKVNTYADLPAAGDYTGQIYVVLTATGVWGVNRKRTGMWRSDGVNWGRLGIAPTAEELRAVTRATFDAHAHNYRKHTEIAVSRDHLYTSVERFPIGDDKETVAFSGNNIDVEAVGVTVATQPTSTPV